MPWLGKARVEEDRDEVDREWRRRFRREWDAMLALRSAVSSSPVRRFIARWCWMLLAGLALGLLVAPVAGAVITEFPIPSPRSGAIGSSGITSGPDGALWFTEHAAAKIGRVTTAGTVTNEFPLPTHNSEPEGIVAGRDGALWFTEL